MKRYIPTEQSIKSLLQTTRTQRESLTIGLRDQKVELWRDSPSAKRQGARHRHKTVNRTVHFIYFDADTHHWIGSVHRGQTDWQKVVWDNSLKKWQEVREDDEAEMVSISKEEYNRLKQQQDSNKE